MSRGLQETIPIPPAWWKKLDEFARSKGVETDEELCQLRPGTISAKTIKKARIDGEMTVASFRKLARVLEYQHSQDLIDAWGEAADPAPSLKTSTPNNLPRLQPFFGRTEELKKVNDALDRSSAGWGILIHGPGG